ncbi:hypothetical protein LCGC14_2586080, partial [marine sediment metagenome]
MSTRRPIEAELNLEMAIIEDQLEQANHPVPNQTILRNLANIQLENNRRRAQRQDALTRKQGWGNLPF